jgi:hypothetical protein
VYPISHSLSRPKVGQCEGSGFGVRGSAETGGKGTRRRGDSRHPPPAPARHSGPQSAPPYSPASSKSSRTRFPFTPVCGEVLGTVDFEDQFQLDATKVGGVGRKGILAAKFLVGDSPVANPLPGCTVELVGGGALGKSELDGPASGSRRRGELDFQESLMKRLARML